MGDTKADLERALENAEIARKRAESEVDGLRTSLYEMGQQWRQAKAALAAAEARATQAEAETARVRRDGEAQTAHIVDRYRDALRVQNDLALERLERANAAEAEVQSQREALRDFAHDKNETDRAYAAARQDREAAESRVRTLEEALDRVVSTWDAERLASTSMHLAIEFARTFLPSAALSVPPREPATPDYWGPGMYHDRLNDTDAGSDSISGCISVSTPAGPRCANPEHWKRFAVEETPREPAEVPYTGSLAREVVGRCPCGGELVRFRDARTCSAQCLKCKAWRMPGHAPSPSPRSNEKESP